jgi:hypothetical protein
MNTISQHTTHQHIEKQQIGATTWQRLVSYGEENRYGIISFVILVIGCLGGLTMMYGAAHSTLVLIAVVIPTMTTLSLLLAVAPMRLLYIAFGITVITDLLVLLGMSF